MSQITNHVLDPYNVPVLVDADLVKIKNSISEDLYQLALQEVFGYTNCKEKDWDKVIKRYLIIDMFTCTDAVTLDEQQLECLVGNAFKGLLKDVPCDKKIYTSN
jgi:hypothetical protein